MTRILRSILFQIYFCRHKYFFQIYESTNISVIFVEISFVLFFIYFGKHVIRFGDNQDKEYIYVYVFVYISL